MEKGIVAVVVHALRIKWEVRVRGRVRGTMEVRKDCNRDFKEVGTWGRKKGGKNSRPICRVVNFQGRERRGDRIDPERFHQDHPGRKTHLIGVRPAVGRE